jgi:ribosomal protein L9
MWHSVIDIYSIHISRLYGSLHNKELIQGLIAQTFTIERKDISLKSASNLNGNLNCSKELEHYAS